MTREHPMGAYVAADTPLPTRDLPAQAVSAQDSDRSWQTSSFDLLDGLQVSELPLRGLADRRCDGLGDGLGNEGRDDPVRPAA